MGLLSVCVDRMVGPVSKYSKRNSSSRAVMLQKLNVNPTVPKFASHATYPGISKVFFFKAPHPLFHVAGNVQYSESPLHLYFLNLFFQRNNKNFTQACLCMGTDMHTHLMSI